MQLRTESVIDLSTRCTLIGSDAGPGCGPDPLGELWAVGAGVAGSTRFSPVQTRRIARFVLAAALVTALAIGATGCGGGATAGDGITSPPSTSGT